VCIKLVVEYIKPCMALSEIKETETEACPDKY